MTPSPDTPPAVGSPEWVERYSLSSRVACRWAQLDLARRDPRVFSLEGDLALPAVPFREEFPERYLQIGISEADLVMTAVGLAMRGKVPFTNSFAAFTTLRACEQVLLDVAYHRANVKLMGYYAGTSGGLAASTHFCVEDFAVTRAMPNVVVLSPADAVEAYKAVFAAAAWDGPVYMRLGRAETPQVYRRDYDFEIGRAVELRAGEDLAILATGVQMVPEALAAAELLEKQGIDARVVNVHTLKPLDREAVVAAGQTGAVVTVEDHNVYAGLGAAVAALLAQEHPVPVVRVGVPDGFCEEVGPQEEMLPLYDMDSVAIAAAARRALALRGERSPILAREA